MIRLTKTPAMLFSKKLNNIAIIQLIEKDLDKLCSIEGDDIKYNNAKKNYLYQSYVVHLMAGWQEFHKSLVLYAFSALEKKCGRDSMSEIAIELLNKVLSARHQIAHKGVSTDKLSYSVNFENMEVIYKMACATEKHVFTSLNIE